MDVLASQISELQQAVKSLASLPSLVGRLSTENEALKAQVNELASSVALLSSENEELKRRDEEKTKTMEEMSKVLPGGHWVWEAGKGEEEAKGRWCWSGVSSLPCVSLPSTSFTHASFRPFIYL